MINRIPFEQTQHDKVIEESAKTYLRVTTENNIYTNPGQLKRFSVKDKFPDLIVKLSDGRVIIEEIETESSVNQQELRQWVEFAELGYDFTLVVPFSKLEQARKLIQGISNIKLQAYSIMGDQIHWINA